jgi:RNA polymerase sigma-70 factor, ECF subfamily
MPGEVASVALMSENLSPGSAVESVAALSVLAERARAGDTTAFDQIMICTQHKIAATAWRMLGSREDARDATQEAYLRAYKYLKSYKSEQDFHGWLYRIIVNVCRDMIRSRHTSATSGTSLSEPSETHFHNEALAVDADSEEAAALAQKRAIMQRALRTLPEKERTAVVLRDLEGLSTDEVAQLMNTRAATVRSQISTARVKLKRYCERFIEAAAERAREPRRNNEV